MLRVLVDSMFCSKLAQISEVFCATHLFAHQKSLITLLMKLKVMFPCNKSAMLLSIAITLQIAVVKTVHFSASIGSSLDSSNTTSNNSVSHFELEVHSVEGIVLKVERRVSRRNLLILFPLIRLLEIAYSFSVELMQ